MKFPHMSGTALQWPFSGAVKQSTRYLTALFVSLATCLLILESYCHVLQQGFFAFLKQLHDLRVWSSFLLIGIEELYIGRAHRKKALHIKIELAQDTTNMIHTALQNEFLLFSQLHMLALIFHY